MPKLLFVKLVICLFIVLFVFTLLVLIMFANGGLGLVFVLHVVYILGFGLFAVYCCVLMCCLLGLVVLCFAVLCLSYISCKFGFGICLLLFMFALVVCLIGLIVFCLVLRGVGLIGYGFVLLY